MKKEITRFGLFVLVASLAVMTGCGYNNNKTTQNNQKQQQQKQQVQPSDKADDMQHSNGYSQSACS